jgi:two-component system, response regulator YesN
MTAPYKVFLVEDEIVTRKGIRTLIDWAAAGFDFCGEAPDGEVALPMIQASQPDVLITDIKMPFMDGLQLSRLVRATLPDLKIIILSGHDEFQYAQQAMQLGITEYLLKPITPQNLAAVLQRVADQLAEARQARENLQGLKDQVEDSLATLREKFLLKVVLGQLPTAEIVEKASQLKLDLLARAYQVLVIRADLCTDAGQPPNFAELGHLDTLIARVTRDRTGLIAFHKDVEEIVLILKGEGIAPLEQHAYFLARLIKEEVESHIACLLTIGLGSPQERLGDLAQSFSEAYAQAHRLSGGINPGGPTGSLDRADLQQLDSAAIEQFLKTGTRAELDAFYDQTLAPVSPALLASPVLLHYFIVDMLITTARFISHLGGHPADVLAQWPQPETVISQIQTPPHLKAQTCQALRAALDFRDRQASKQYDDVIGKAQLYIDAHYTEPALSLHQVAAHVALSASHFSLLFGRKTGETFIEYLTRKRIDRARELLRTTHLNAKEIALAVGYNHPRYFYLVFKKVTGFSPTEFRLTAQPGAQA